MTTLKHLVALAKVLQQQIDDGDGAHPQDYHEVCHAVFNAIPEIEALLEQEPGKAPVFAWYRDIAGVRQFSDKICAPDDGWRPLYCVSSPHPEAASVPEPQAGVEASEAELFETADAFATDLTIRLQGGHFISLAEVREVMLVCLRKHASQHISEGKMLGKES